MEKHLSAAKYQHLYKTLLKLKSVAEVKSFLRDLCTIQELEDMASRWEAVQLINKKVPYRAIAKQTSLSTATVTRIAWWLRSGAGGYRAALKKSR